MVDKLLRSLPQVHRKAVGMQNPVTKCELVQGVELAEVAQAQDIGKRARGFPRRVPSDRRPLEGTSRPVGRPVMIGPRDEPMPTDPNPSEVWAWLAGCIVHRAIPSGAPERRVRIDGRPVRA